MDEDNRKCNTGRVPDHLPQKLSISFWYHDWLAAALPGAPFEDLERCMKGMKQRGFNTARVGLGMTYAFRLDGTPRGPIDFGPPVPGYALNPYYACHGGRRDVIERLLRLLDLARRNDVWIILTSWEYQDSSCVSDPAVRADLASVPWPNRFRYLAEQHDRLLTMLKAERLADRLAFVEIHNEPEYSDLPQGAEGRRRHEEAIAFLRARHPEILVSGDFASHDYSIVPDNAQVFDQHIYAGAGWHLSGLYGRTVSSKEADPLNPRAFEPLRRVLKKDIMPWDKYLAAAGKVGREDKAATEGWKRMLWLWENIDAAKWDEFMAGSFPEWKERIWEKARKTFAEDAAEGKRRGLPLVLDEGGYFCPPPQSRWELTPDGLALLELFADLAIRHGYWGFMPGTYCGPQHIIWREKPEWLRQINGRFQAGRDGPKPPERQGATAAP
ncbi:MAG: cellulase-like family protein [Kiritimatiellia bacterium]